ncbi:hypothetical protein [Arcobacter sp. LA11]|uniref:hypothetical protein n=1 Tax=Arcobacter sp. LA11 TaxID=1898176 RepID=UPI001160A4BC|nr:hypothetical protein [Arcobacter sp. LA11]
MNYIDIMFKLSSTIKNLLDMMGIKIPNFLIKHKIPNYIRKDKINYFTDRKSILQKLLIASSSNNTINIYGKKGSGKSHTLKFFADCINNKVSKKLSKEYNLNKKIKIKYILYYDITHQTGIEGIRDSLCIESKNNNIKIISKLFSEEIKKMVSNNDVIIILDNVNNKGIYKTISNLIDSYLQYRHNDLFIIGSIERYKSSTDPYIKYLNVEKFSKEDIEEYYKKHNITKLEKNQINKIYSITKQGLPLLVHIVKNFPLEKISLVNEQEIYKYIYDELIDTLDKQTLDLLLLLSFINISTTTIKEKDLIKSFEVGNYELLKKSLIDIGLLIETGENIKVHDELRDLINHHNLSKFKYFENNINKYIQNSNSDKKVFYHLLSFYENQNNPKLILNTLNNEISQNNFSIFEELLALIKRFGLKFNSYPEIQFTLYYGIAYSFNGSGEYLLAQNILNSKEIINTLKEISKEDYLRFIILKIDIAHMLNKYQKSEEKLQKLIQEEIEITNYNILAQCYWKLGHIKLHRSYCFQDTLNNYNKAITYKKFLHNNPYILNATIETYITYLLKNNLNCFNELLDMEDNFKVDILSYISYERIISRFYKMKEDFSLAHIYVNRSYTHAKEIFSKLHNNAELERADIYRAEENYVEAINCYQNVLLYTKNSMDSNLELSSRLGILISNLLIHKDKIEFYKEEILDELKEIIFESKKLEINITLLRAQVAQHFLYKNLKQTSPCNKKTLLKQLKEFELNFELDILKNKSEIKLKNMQSTIF